MSKLSLLLSATVPLVLMVAALFAPPTHGAMLAVPLGHAPAHVLMGQEGVTLEGTGPLSGSLMIRAAETPFFWALGHGVLLLRGGAFGCKETGRNAEV